jgi:large subunit ribosomal protein L28e
MSSALVWELVKRNSSFLVRRDGKTFSREPGNVMNVNRKRFSGLANSKAINVHLVKKNLQLGLKKRSSKNKVAKSWQEFKIGKGKEIFQKIRKVIRNGRYRRDLEGLAQKRAFILSRAADRALKSPKWLERKLKRYQIKKSGPKK